MLEIRPRLSHVIAYVLISTLVRVLVNLQGRSHGKTFLEVIEGCVFQSTIADKIVKLVPSLENVEVEDVLGTHNVLFLQNSNVSIDVQVF